jgi:hypothetical protein
MDSTAWGVVLAKRLNSEHFKLLYDITTYKLMKAM